MWGVDRSALSGSATQLNGSSTPTQYPANAPRHLEMTWRFALLLRGEGDY